MALVILFFQKTWSAAKCPQWSWWKSTTPAGWPRPLPPASMYPESTTDSPARLSLRPTGSPGMIYRWARTRANTCAIATTAIICRSRFWSRCSSATQLHSKGKLCSISAERKQEVKKKERDHSVSLENGDFSRLISSLFITLYHTHSKNIAHRAHVFSSFSVIYCYCWNSLSSICFLFLYGHLTSISKTILHKSKYPACGVRVRVVLLLLEHYSAAPLEPSGEKEHRGLGLELGSGLGWGLGLGLESR